jgi:hypothetical protein
MAPARVDRMVYSGIIRPAAKGARSGDPEEMSVKELSYFIDNAGFGIKPTYVYETWRFKRLSLFLSSFLMIALCVPLASRFRRGGGLGQDAAVLHGRAHHVAGGLPQPRLDDGRQAALGHEADLIRSCPDAARHGLLGRIREEGGATALPVEAGGVCPTRVRGRAPGLAGGRIQRLTRRGVEEAGGGHGGGHDRDATRRTPQALPRPHAAMPMARRVVGCRLRLPHGARRQPTTRREGV